MKLIIEKTIKKVAGTCFKLLYGGRSAKPKSIVRKGRSLGLKVWRSPSQRSLAFHWRIEL